MPSLLTQSIGQASAVLAPTTTPQVSPRDAQGQLPTHQEVLQNVAATAQAVVNHVKVEDKSRVAQVPKRVEGSYSAQIKRRNSKVKDRPEVDDGGQGGSENGAAQAPVDYKV